MEREGHTDRGQTDRQADAMRRERGKRGGGSEDKQREKWGQADKQRQKGKTWGKRERERQQRQTGRCNEKENPQKTVLR